MNGPRVLQLISSVGFYGAENVVLVLSSALEELGASVTVGAFKNLHNPNLELCAKAGESGLDTEVFECGGKIDLRTISRISSYVRANNVDIIHCHGYKANVYAYLANLKNRRLLVSSCHNWLNVNAKMSSYNFFDKMLLRKFDAVISVSNAGAEILRKAGFKNEKIHVIENGISIGRFTSASSIRRTGKQAPTGKTRVIGTVGRLTNEKGHIHLLTAAKRILERHDCLFYIIGDGVLRAKLEEEAARLGIKEKVVLTGKRGNIPELLSMMDVFVLPSLIEAQPMALLEAMAARKPVVASAVGDIPRILQGGRAGILIPPAEPEALAEAIISLLEDSTRASACADAAFEEAIEKYSSARMAKEYMKIYREIMADRK